MGLCRRNSGFTLVTGLVFLVLLTMVGTTAIQSSVVQQKSSGNLYDKERSFQAAESGLAAGEDWLEASTDEPVVSTGCTQPCVNPHDNSLFIEDSDTAWWSANASQMTATISGINDNPWFYIEHVSFIPDDITIGGGPPKGVNFYQISAVGVGGTSTATSVVTSTYSKRF